MAARSPPESLPANNQFFCQGQGPDCIISGLLKLPGVRRWNLLAAEGRASHPQKRPSPGLIAKIAEKRGVQPLELHFPTVVAFAPGKSQKKWRCS
jgi:hypothetical protein